MNSSRLLTDALVIGSGIAGATCALTLARQGVDVALLTASDSLVDNNTALAQGGIVFQPNDEPERTLVDDILNAGWKHNYRKAVKHLATEGPVSVQRILIDDLEIPFHKGQDGKWDLTREGAHSQERILHCADFTGRAIMEGLANAVEAHPNIRLLTHRTAIDLLTTHHQSNSLEVKYSLTNQCAGAYVFNDRSKQVETILSNYTILATGGAGKVYLHTTNTDASIGSGLAMAHRAGAHVMNAEYVQFHPTALFHKAKKRFLISEAVRGEGAKLFNSAGEAFMPRYDSRADLAPRDIVTRAIMDELLHSGDPCVYLDAANHVPLDLEQRFPTIFNRCKDAGVDMTSEPIPVVPAAHYFCGGVLCDSNGKTTLERLYAVGECSCTGVHGANRLASTSLLEGLLWGENAGKEIAKKINKRSRLRRQIVDSIPEWKSPGTIMNEDAALVAQDWAAIRHTMWNYVGINRSTARLKRAINDLRNQYHHLQKFYRETPISKPLIDLFHGAQAAHIITLAALRNTESIGCHYRTD